MRLLRAFLVFFAARWWTKGAETGEIMEMTPNEQQEYAALYTRRKELQSALSARLAGGVQSATLSTGGNTESYTALPVSELRAEIRAITARMRQLLGGVLSPWCYRDAPDFGR